MTLAKHYRTKPAPKLHTNDRLDDRGREKLDDESVVGVCEFRPATLQEQIARLNQAGEIYRGEIHEQDLEDDDFAEDFDDIPGEGLTPYELDALPKPPKKSKKKSTPDAPKTGESATPKEGVANEKSAAPGGDNSPASPKEKTPE